MVRMVETGRVQLSATTSAIVLTPNFSKKRSLSGTNQKATSQSGRTFHEPRNALKPSNHAAVRNSKHPPLPLFYLFPSLHQPNQTPIPTLKRHPHLLPPLPLPIPTLHPPKPPRQTHKHIRALRKHKSLARAAPWPAAKRRVLPARADSVPTRGTEEVRVGAPEGGVAQHGAVVDFDVGAAGDVEGRRGG